MTPLLDYGDGDFLRPSEASYRSGDGTLKWATANELRREQLDDGFGPVALLEESRCNLVDDTASWTGTDAVVGTTATGAPDGGAYTTLKANGSATAKLRSSSTSVQQDYSATVWLRAATATRATLTAGTAVFSRVASPGWGRSVGFVTGTQGFLELALGWPDAPAVSGAELGVFGAQLEAGAFPTSFTRARCGVGARAEERLRMNSAAPLTGGPFRVHIWPAVDSDIPTNEMVIFAFGPPDTVILNDVISLQWFSGAPTITVRAGGLTIGSTGALEFRRGQRLELEVDATRGRLTVNGVSLSVTPWSWPSTDGFTVGGELDDKGVWRYPWTGRLSEPLPVP